jgi:hypothetical protein
MKTLHAASEIDAPAETVWRVVADLGGYKDWNPFITRASGQTAVGSRLDVTITAPGMKPVRFKPRVLDYEPGHLIRWKGEYKVAGLFDGRHALIVDPLGDSRSRFTTHEEVSGVLVPFLGRIMAASQTGFERMAQAVKARAESLERAGGAGAAG